MLNHGGVKRKKIGLFSLCLAILLFMQLLGGCGKKDKGKKLVRECVLPGDQDATLSGRWAAVPVPIALKAGNFNPDEAKEFVSASDNWNQFTAASLGFQALNYGDPANPAQSNAQKPSALCSQSILRGHEFSGSVVLYKHDKWPYRSKGVIALTSFCPRMVPGKSYPNIFMAILELNYQDFFVEGKPQPDLQSILLHELGHLLGLNHSCESAKKAGFPDCRDPNLPVPYYTASMFPIFSFDDRGGGEKRQLLGENDQGRTNCLYKDLLEDEG